MEHTISQSAANILFVTGDQTAMRLVFEEHGFAYWTACFDVLLEKHGLISFDKASFDILKRVKNLEPYDLLIISWLPENFWKPKYIEAIDRFKGIVFIEGPFPKYVAEYLGLSPRIEPSFYDRNERSVLGASSTNLCKEGGGAKHFLSFPEGDLVAEIQIFPKQVSTSANEPARQVLEFSAEHPLEQRLNDIVLSYLIAYKNRFQKDSRFFSSTKLNGLAILVLLEALAKINSVGRRKQYKELLRKALSEPTVQSSFINITGEEAEEVSIFGCVLAMAAKFLEEPDFADESSLFSERAFDALDKLKRIPLTAGAWALVLAAMDNREQPSPRAREFVVREGHKFLGLIKESKVSFVPVLLWTLAFSLSRIENARGELFENLSSALAEKIKPLTYVERGRLSPGLENRNLWEVLLIAGAAALLDLKENAFLLLQFCLEKTFDPEKGFFHNARVAKGGFRLETGYHSGPWAVLGILPAIDAICLRNFSEYLQLYEPQQRRAWARPPYQIKYYASKSCEELVSLTRNDEKVVGLFRKGKIFGSTFQLLSYLVHYHTLHPVEEPLLDCPASHILPLENFLFCMLDQQAAQFGIPLLKVAPWPWGKKYCLTVRHDMDRIPDENTFRRLLAFENERNLGVSWHWIPGRTDESLIRLTEEVGHENGLHAMRLDQKPQEKTEIESCLGNQKQVSGESWHGGGGGDYWIGQPSVKAAIGAGMLYTELMPTVYDFPYAGFPILDKQGLVRSDRIVGLTHNCSPDAGPRKDKKIYDIGWLLELANKGCYCLLLSHPDVNFEKFRSWIEALPEEGRLDWTCEEVAKWWKKTHQRERLNISKLFSSNGKSVFELISRDGVHGLELLFPLEDKDVLTVEIDCGTGFQPAQWEYSSGVGAIDVRIRVDLPRERTVCVLVDRDICSFSDKSRQTHHE